MALHDLRRFPALRPFSQVGSELTVRDMRVTELAERYGTPLYLYDGNVIEEAYHSVVKALPQFEVFFSIKANPSFAVCRLLNRLGAGAETASGMELQLALKAGFDPSKIVFAGPAKTDWELDLAVRNAIASVNVESYGELARLEATAARNNTRATACLRINCLETNISASEVMAIGPSKFGIDEETVFADLRQWRLRHVDLKGIHLYIASDLLEVEAVIANLKRALSLGVDWIQKTDHQLEQVVFGGGFGVPYGADETELQMGRLSSAVGQLLESFNSVFPISNKRLILELGRFLVARAGIFLTRIIDIKVSRGKTYVATDGGMNQLVRPVFLGISHPTLVVNRMGERETMVVDIGGPLCTPLDILAGNISVPNVQVGDIVGVFNAGAYGFSMSMLDFLSHPRPAEILLWNGRPHLIRERSTLEDALSLQTAPPSLARSP